MSKRLAEEITDEVELIKRQKVEEGKENIHVQRQTLSPKVGTSNWLKNPDFPELPDGRTMHLAVKRGDVANRILSVGDYERAFRLSRLLDDPANLHITTSTRGFTVYTGTFNGKPVSIAATGMGVAMMDFVVRETRHVIDGPMAVVRYGTCGLINNKIEVGSVVVASKGAVMIKANNDYDEETDQPSDAYHFSKIVPSDEQLTKLVFNRLQASLTDKAVFEGLNATGETFYGAQGRKDNNFADYNEELIDQLRKQYPEATNLEMETYALLFLAKRSKPQAKIYATAAAIGLINRESHKIISEGKIKELEILGGMAILRALSSFNFAEGEPAFTKTVLKAINKEPIGAGATDCSSPTVSTN